MHEKHPLMLLFYLGKERYVISLDSVIQVVPFVELLPMPKKHQALLGALDFRGDLTTVVDLKKFMKDQFCTHSYHSRIILCEFEKTKYIGFLVEQLLETIHIPSKREEIQIKEAPYLTHSLRDDEGLLQEFSLTLLNQKIQEVLF